MPDDIYKTLLTIVMPAHNAAEFIEKTLQSFLQQSFIQWKLLVIDDASTDNTWELIQQWQIKDARIIGIRNETNLKVARTMNKGITLADTPYFARVDSDDMLLPGHFEKVIHYLDSHPDISICGSQVITIDAKDNFRRKWNYETDPDWVKMSAVFACPFLQSAVVMRTEVIKQLGGYRPEMELIEDYELWIRALQQYEAANIPDYTIQYRIHDHNMSETNKTTILKMLEGMYRDNSNAMPIDITRLALHARMEVGEWGGLSFKALQELIKWKKQLSAINQKAHYYPVALYGKVLGKYFTNAFLKIATQNKGKLRLFALIRAFLSSPKWLFIIFKRKKENGSSGME